MKKLFNVIVITLALNFLALAGGVGWLFRTGQLDKGRIADIKKIVFPPPVSKAPETQPVKADPATTQPFLKLDELLAQKAGLPAGQQLEFLQQTFDAKTAELDRRQQELRALKDQVDRAQAELTEKRTALLEQQRQLDAREQESARLAADKGFQDSLAVYTTTPARQVKKIFATLDDDTVVRYLRAMEPRAASKIVKEFKTPTDVERIQRILEQMRRAEPPTPATQPAAAQAGQGPEAPTAAAPKE